MILIGGYTMDTRFEKKEVAETTPQESTGDISAQGISSMQGVDVRESQPDVSKVEAVETPVETPVAKGDFPTTPAVPPAGDANPPSDFQPQRSDGTEVGTAKKIETGVEKPEKKEFRMKEGEREKPGGLGWHPGGPESGG
jgi:hypothetical protein